MSFLVLNWCLVHPKCYKYFPLCEASIVFFHNRKEMREERERRLATRRTTVRLAMLSAGVLMLRDGKYIGKIISLV